MPSLYQRTNLSSIRLMMLWFESSAGINENFKKCQMKKKKKIKEQVEDFAIPPTRIAYTTIKKAHMLFEINPQFFAHVKPCLLPLPVKRKLKSSKKNFYMKSRDGEKKK